MIWSWYTGRWWVGCYIWYSEERTGRGSSPPRPPITVPNVTVRPSTASVPTIVLLYNGPLVCADRYCVEWHIFVVTRCSAVLLMTLVQCCANTESWPLFTSLKVCLIFTNSKTNSYEFSSLLVQQLTLRCRAPITSHVYLMPRNIMTFCYFFVLRCKYVAYLFSYLSNSFLVHVLAVFYCHMILSDPHNCSKTNTTFFLVL